AHLTIAASQRGHPGNGGYREFEEQIVTGSAALADHLNGIDEAAQVFVLQAAVSAKRRAGIKEQLQRQWSLARPFARAPCPCIWPLTSPGINSFKVASTTAVPSGTAMPGNPISRIASPSIRTSIGSARCRLISSTRPFRITVWREPSMVTAPGCR